jgi:hypothetical protein
LWDEKPVLWSFLKYIDRNPTLKTSLADNVEKAKKLMQRNNASVHAMLKWVRKLKKATDRINFSNQDFGNFVFNLEQSIPYARGNDLDYRETEIANNYRKYIEEGEKVYGQYGATHIALKNGERIGWNTFGSVLNGDSYYRGKILSIGLVCIGCDPDSPKHSGDFPGPDIFHHFLTQEDFDRLKPEFLILPPNTFVDLSETDEKIKDYCQLLLVQFD